MTKKDKILLAATRMFAGKGFADTSTAELAGITGAAESTIFYHFKNKEELFLEVLRKVRVEIVQHFEEHEGSQEYESGLEKVEGLLGYYLYLAGTMEDAFLLLHRHYPYLLAQENEVCRENLEAVYNCMADIFERAIEEGKRDGSVADIPARKTALILFTMVDGLVRFKTYNLYDAGTLFKEMIASARKILVHAQ
ncbi:TetR/AcrR family transcriptional regulator [Desulfovibrio ferrophilus]|uniref:Transcriptional regulator, TetR family n=1 Tax=Desulfovibrio ferrophilus TaxID=241368 RepID=A0A2Z6AVT8_9BACT|nr:TetR/AcrR family transcriptional regulator [Desulfovibrio ferrophilus]BBD07369.1 transcriptional regulator, TetR family [Desulfovibrio ferrophilus]